MEITMKRKILSWMLILAVLFGFCPLFVSDALAADYNLADNPRVTLTGTVFEFTGYDFRNQPESAIGLRLDQSFTADTGPYAGVVTVTEIQLVNNTSQRLKDYTGKHVSVYGDIWAAHTAHHHRDVLMSVEKISEAAPSGGASGKCGNNVTWSFNSSTGELTISGTGPMWDFESDKQPWGSFSKFIKAVVVKSGVTSVGAEAFSSFDTYPSESKYSNMVSVILPTGLEKIGKDAFDGVPITEIVLPNGLKEIGVQAFAETKLRKVIFPNTLTTINSHAFMWTKLSEARIPHSVTTIDRCALGYNLSEGGGPAPQPGFTIYGFPGSAAEKYASGVFSFIPTIGGFGDVYADDWFADSVQWAIESSITNGTGVETFSPNATCTTAQILTFLWRAAGSPEPNVPNPFSDVKSSDYFYKPALWASQNGLVLGSALGGSSPCTRAATVTYLWKLSGSPSVSGSSFTDVSSSAAYAKAVAWAVSNGITGGTGNNQFSPDATCTRGQIVTFLYRWDKSGQTIQQTGTVDAFKDVAYYGSSLSCRMSREMALAYAEALNNLPTESTWYNDNLKQNAAFLYDVSEDGYPLLMTCATYHVAELDGDLAGELFVWEFRDGKAQKYDFSKDGAKTGQKFGRTYSYVGNCCMVGSLGGKTVLCAEGAGNDEEDIKLFYQVSNAQLTLLHSYNEISSQKYYYDGAPLSIEQKGNEYWLDARDRAIGWKGETYIRMINDFGGSLIINASPVGDVAAALRAYAANH